MPLSHVLAATVPGQFRYTDKAGNEVMVGSKLEVPPEYRDQAKELTSELTVSPLEKSAVNVESSSQTQSRSLKASLDIAAMRSYAGIMGSAKVMEKRYDIPAWTAVIPMIFVGILAWKLLRKGVGGFVFKLGAVSLLGFVGLFSYGSFLHGDLQKQVRATLGKPLDKVDEARGTVNAAEAATQERFEQLNKISE